MEVVPGRTPDAGRGGERTIAATVRVLDAAYLLGADHRRLFLVRHGHAAQSSPGGPYDPPLSASGREQAGSLGERLGRLLDPARTTIVASPRRRTAETAAIVGERLGLPVATEERLAEVGGLAAPVPVWVTDRPWRVPQFRWDEPDGPFRPRAMAGVRAALAVADSPNVVVVTHGGVINAFVAEVLGLRGEFFCYPRNTSLTVLRVRDHEVVLDRLNDAAHLEEAGS